MVLTIAYLLTIFLEILFAIGFSIYTAFLIYSNIKGAPYVPTKNKELEYILKEARLKKGQVFYELGCGDGRVVRKAVEKYQVKGVGVDVNPLLLSMARFWTKIKKIKQIEFRRENMFNTNIKHADYIYLFLMPNLVARLVPKFEKELKKRAIVISHGFKIDIWKKYCYKTINHKPFPTYYYRFGKT